MNALLRRLPAFALPFVTRSLRGGRGRRFAALSLALALLTLVFALWVGLGRGVAARDARIELGVEQHPHVREQLEFMVIRNAWDDPTVLAARAEGLEREGLELIRQAALSPRDADHELRDRAFELAQLDPQFDEGLRQHILAPLGAFPWQNKYQVERLRHILAHEGKVGVVDYEPALAPADTLHLLGMLTGGLLLGLVLIVAPLLVAMQQAAERHENTLQPLTGTGLHPRELIVGMACGPLAIVAIFAAPLAAMFVTAALALGRPEALLVVLTSLAVGVGLVFGAQLLAHMLGSRRTPGMIGVALLSLLGFVTLGGIGLASTLDHETLGLTAVLPHGGMFALLGESFGDPWQAARVAYGHRAYPVTLDSGIGPWVVGVAGAALLGLVALLALTRHVEGRPALLEARHAWFGALVCGVMVALALPHQAGAPIHAALGLPMLALPFMLLVMGRVPVGEVPTKLRRIPLTRLGLEFAGWVAVFLAAAILLDGTLDILHPITLAGLAWCSIVLVLLALRMVATPAQILAHAWAVVCLLVVPFTYGLAMVPAFENGAAFEGALRGVPAFVSLAWLALLVTIPLTLLAHLRRHVGRVE